MLEKAALKNKGFTIIELIVVIAVLLFVLSAAIGVFISMVQQQRKVLREQQLLNQIGYVQEYMSKAMRMARADTDAENCLGEDEFGERYIYLLTRYSPELSAYGGIRFITQVGESATCQEFFLDTTDQVLKELKGAGVPDNEAVALTSTDVQIDKLGFSINGLTCTGGPCGVSQSYEGQPKVTTVLKAKIANDGEEPFMTFQTTVSQRNLNTQ